MSYRLLVLPDRKTISPAVLKRLGEFVNAGATIVGPKPERSNSLKGYPDCDREVRKLAAQIWGNCDGDKVRTHAFGQGKVLWNVPLTNALADLGIAPDFVAENISNEDRHIDYIHRTTAEEDIYFVSNSSTNRATVTCRFRVGAGNREAERFERADVVRKLRRDERQHLVRYRVRLEAQRRRSGWVAGAPFRLVEEPGVRVEALQGHEPHLPVEVQVVGGDEAGAAQGVARLAGQLVVEPGGARDRKSTRLNSSHRT